MPITPNIEEWLHNAGYEYHCFVSYPRIRNNEMMECAERVKEYIEAELAWTVNTPRVFLDRSMTGGANWEMTLRRALCRSISMVALCSPIYYHPAHKWCGLEWEAMYGLENQRLQGEEFHAIVPLIVRDPKHLPNAVSKIQYIDISRVTIAGRRYYKTQEFRSHMRDVTDRIIKVAMTIARNQAATNCIQFQFPQNSAFENYEATTQSAPFRSE
jgi:TIR domain